MLESSLASGPKSESQCWGICVQVTACVLFERFGAPGQTELSMAGVLTLHGLLVGLPGCRAKGLRLAEPGRRCPLPASLCCAARLWLIAFSDPFQQVVATNVPPEDQDSSGDDSDSFSGSGAGKVDSTQDSSGHGRCQARCLPGSVSTAPSSPSWLGVWSVLPAAA